MHFRRETDKLDETGVGRVMKRRENWQLFPSEEGIVHSSVKVARDRGVKKRSRLPGKTGLPACIVGEDRNYDLHMDTSRIIGYGK